MAAVCGNRRAHDAPIVMHANALQEEVGAIQIEAFVRIKVEPSKSE